MSDQREPVAVIPPGCSTEQVSELIDVLNRMVLGHELHMGNQDDGSIVIFYYRDLEAARQQQANDLIVEEPDVNVELEFGFTQDNGKPGVMSYASSESDEVVLGLASYMIPILENHDAANYVTTTILHDDLKYAVTVQKVPGLTPAEKLVVLEERVRELMQTNGEITAECARQLDEAQDLIAFLSERSDQAQLVKAEIDKLVLTERAQVLADIDTYDHWNTGTVLDEGYPTTSDASDARQRVFDAAVRILDTLKGLT